MADKNNTGEFSMDSYVNERLAEDVEPNNPFEVPQGDGGKKPKKAKRNFRKKLKNVNFKSKKTLIIAAAVFVLILFLIIFIWIRVRRNDGARYARLLS